IDASSSDQPSPTTLFPAPLSYDRRSGGAVPLRAGVSGRGSDSESVPFAALTANFSSMPLIAPPPLGSEIEGAPSWNFGSSPPEPSSGDAAGESAEGEREAPCVVR